MSAHWHIHFKPGLTRMVCNAQMHTSDHRHFQPQHAYPLPTERSPAFTLSLWLGVALLLATVAWDASGADLTVMAWLADQRGFPLRDHWWLKNVMHDAFKQLAVLVYILVWVMAVRPMGIFRSLHRLQRLEMALGITLSLILVTAIKRMSLTSCPWELQAFGGAAQYVSHWSWGVADGGSGYCFPGGHASSAFAFLAMAVPWLKSPQPGEQRLGLVLTGAIVVTGLVLGVVQTLRGAHYPSHTAWTAVVCAAVAWANHGLFLAGAKWRLAKAGRSAASLTSSARD